MIKLLKALVLVALAPCLAWGADGWPSLDEPAPKVGGGERDVALVVSIEDYAKLPDIAGAEANGRAWVRWFEGTRGLRPDKVVWLKDSEGTPSEMLAKAGELSALADPKGMIWVVFIGHGAPAEDQSEGMLVGWGAQQSPRELYSQSLRQSELLAALGNGERGRPGEALGGQRGRVVSGQVRPVRGSAARTRPTRLQLPPARRAARLGRRPGPCRRKGCHGHQPPRGFGGWALPTRVCTSRSRRGPAESSARATARSCTSRPIAISRCGSLICTAMVKGS